MHSVHPSFFVLPLAALFTVGLGASACSGPTDQGVNGLSSPNAASGSGLPCCHGGFIYKCASDSALNVCSDAAQDDTTDCTKTSTACGGDGATPNPNPSSTSTTKPPPPPPPATKKTGEPCNGPTECQGGQCLVFISGTIGFCSNLCSNAGQCPPQFRCQLVASIGNKLCTPMGEGKLGDPCAFGPDCASDLCITPSAGGKGYCSATCNAPADCGTNWLCAAANGGAGKFCQR